MNISIKSQAHTAYGERGDIIFLLLFFFSFFCILVSQAASKYEQ